jgi:hypothetical protein
VTIEPPTATLVSDSTVGNERRVVLHVAAAPGTEVIGMQAANDTRVLRASVDGRVIDPSRYRGGGLGPWRLTFSGPPDTGLTLGLTVPAESPIALELVSRSRGLPSLPTVRIPNRPDDVVAIQTGDVTVQHREVRIR